MDDTAFDRYYLENEMLAIGRWGAYIVYNILNVTEFIPFWIDFMASCMIVLTAVLVITYPKLSTVTKITAAINILLLQKYLIVFL